MQKGNAPRGSKHWLPAVLRDLMGTGAWVLTQEQADTLTEAIPELLAIPEPGGSWPPRLHSEAAPVHVEVEPLTNVLADQWEPPPHASAWRVAPPPVTGVSPTRLELAQAFREGANVLLMRIVGDAAEVWRFYCAELSAAHGARE